MTRQKSNSAAELSEKLLHQTTKKKSIVLKFCHVNVQVILVDESWLYSLQVFGKSNHF